MPENNPSSPLGGAQATSVAETWAYQARRKRADQPLSYTIGKAFGRTVHQTIPFGTVVDEAKIYLALSSADVMDVPELSQQIFAKYYTWVRRKFGSSLDKKILNDSPNWDFRNSFSQSLQEGRAQARADDIAALKSICPDWPAFSELPHNHTRGWATEEYAKMLQTPDLHWTDPEMRQALNHGIIDAPSNQGFAGLYEGYEFPNDDQHPLNGFCRSRLFVDAALGIFIGPRASKRLPIAARGRRSKAAVSGMTSITKSAIAYVAMLLRFTLHQAPSWYSIESANDSRFNYFCFYSEMLALLEEEEFKSEVDSLIAFLNTELFPHFHLLPRDIPGNGAQSTRERALAIVRARQA